MEAERLVVRRGQREVLQGCSVRVRAGHLHMLLGPNGCGKSTLLRTLAGLLTPSAGRLAVAAPRAFVFQNPDHQVVLPSVGADVAFGLSRHAGMPREEVQRRVADALATVGLAGFESRLVQTLSGGQKQRVAIAGALAERPSLLLLDELTTFLDPEDQMSVLRAVRDVTATGVTALWVTHRLEELPFADAATYMEDGAVVTTGTPDSVGRFIEQLRSVATSS